MRFRHPAIREDDTPMLVWLLLAAVCILGVTVVTGGLYLNARRGLLDQHNRLTAAQVHALRQGVCQVLDPINAAQVPGVAAARAYPFPTGNGRTVPLCVPQKPHPPILPKTPRPIVTLTTAPGVVTVTQPGAVVTVRPRTTPTVVRTVTARPSHAPTHHPPSPTPRPTATCNLNHLIRCLPTTHTALEPPN